MHEGHHGILDGLKKDKGPSDPHPQVHSHDGGPAHSHSDGEHVHQHVDAAAGKLSTHERYRRLAIGIVVLLFSALFFLIARR